MNEMRVLRLVCVLVLMGLLSGPLCCLGPTGGGAGPRPGAAVAAAPPPVAAAPYVGLKKRIAVAKFEFGASRRWLDDIVEFGSGLADMLTTELHRTGRFIVVERKELDAVLTEQDLATAGRISKATAARTGELLGAEYLVAGVITEFEEKASGTGGGIGGPIGNVGVLLGGARSSAHIGIDIRLIDSTTGAIVQAHTARGNATGFGIAGGLSYKGWTAAGGHREQTAVGKAVRQIMDQIVAFVVHGMEPVPWKAKVAAVQGDKIYINAGQNMNVAAGATFEVAGEPVVDPDTGKVIAYGEAIGLIRVTQVLPEAAICALVDGQMPERGATIQASAALAPPAAPATTQQPVAAGQDAASFCVQCGAKLAPDAKFCPNCGAQVW